MAAIATTTQVERYEYKFVRVGEYRGSALFGVRDSEREAYQGVVHEHARQGWRLVQIFAPRHRGLRRRPLLRADLRTRAA